MKRIAEEAGEQIEFPTPKQPSEIPAYEVLVDPSLNLVAVAKQIATAYLEQDIAEQSTEGTQSGRSTPREQVVIIVENKADLSNRRRKGTNAIFQARKELVGTFHLQQPQEVGIDPEQVKLVLRVDSGSAEPLQPWFPRVLPHATVYTLRHASQQPAANSQR